MRSGYRTVVAWPRRGEGERAAYNLARMTPAWASEHASPEPGLRFARATLREGFVAAPFRLAVIPEHRLLRRRRGQAPERPRSSVLRSFADLRTGDFVVHEDHGVARFGGFDTKTVAGVTRDYLQLEYAGQDRVFVPSEQLAKISRYVGRRRGGAHAVAAGRDALGPDQGPRAPGGAGAGRRAAQPLRRAPAAHRPPVPARLRLAARLREPLRLPGDRRPAGGDRGGQGRHGGRAPDGPPDLRRRGLRQDRGGAAGGVQGGRERQAGADAGARPRSWPSSTTAPSPSDWPTGRCGSSRCRASVPPASSGRPSRPSRRVRWTSSSAPIVCCRATCGPRTWAC